MVEENKEDLITGYSLYPVALGQTVAHTVSLIREIPQDDSEWELKVTTLIRRHIHYGKLVLIMKASDAFVTHKDIYLKWLMRRLTFHRERFAKLTDEILGRSEVKKKYLRTDGSWCRDIKKACRWTYLEFAENRADKVDGFVEETSGNKYIVVRGNTSSSVW